MPVPVIQETPKKLCKKARKQLSRIGFAYLFGTALLIALEISITMILELVYPEENYDSNLFVISNMLLRFLVAYPVMLLLISLVKKGAPIPQKKMKAGDFPVAFFMAYAMAMVANIIGTLLTYIISAFQNSPLENDLQVTLLSLHPIWLILFTCVGAPVFEELIFRKALVDRAIYCGEGTAIILSGIMFGLFHGNLNQFIYAAVLGAFFAFIYIRTGKIRYTMILHAMVNGMAMVGTMFLKLLADQVDFSANSTLQVFQWMSPYYNPVKLGVLLIETVGLLVWLLAVAGFVITGIVLWILKGKKLYLKPAGEAPIPKGRRFCTIFFNPGMLAFVLVWIFIIGSSLFG